MRNSMLTALIVLSATANASAQLTARGVVERIKQSLGVPWNDTTVDTFKDGDPDAPVTGIVVTMMPTLDVLQRAAKAGKNLIIAHEPAFYGHADRLDALAAANDPVTASKRTFIAEHRLVIWRLHDHWHWRKPDGVQAGVIRALGWSDLATGDSTMIRIPATSLGELAAAIRQRLSARSVRVVGDPQLRVTGVALMPGFQGFARHLPMLQRSDVQVAIVGEALEWETMPYVADAVTSGMRKGLIVVGHIPSEQSGMIEFASWLKTIVTEVPVAFIATPEPFWTVP